MKNKIFYTVLFTSLSVPSLYAVAEDTVTTKDNPKDTQTLKKVFVYGEVLSLDDSMRDKEGYDAIYDENYSSDYVGKQRIESYRGTTPSDLLSSLTGVYSGDARNSGAIDPNIRGIQGEGRVVTQIDGTEQAISVSRGYNGASNRNYIDPLLTSNIRVVKDAGLDTGIRTSIGGGLVINTLSVNDFIEDKGGFGGEVRIESSSNATKPRIRKDYDGAKLSDMPDVKLKDINGQYNEWRYTKHPFEVKHTKRKAFDQYNIFGGTDYAARLALGYKADDLNVLGAVALRNRGNYFSGKDHSSFYDNKLNPLSVNSTRSLAKFFVPGQETLNSSSEMTSYLFKLNAKPSASQKIGVNLRRSDSLYGEIMPSSVRASTDDDFGIQWPLSKVIADALSLQYEVNPKDNDYLNLKTNIWMTKTNSDTFNSGGSIAKIDRKNTRDTSDDTIANRAHVSSTHKRKGVDLSNRIKFSDQLSLTTSAQLQKERIKSRIPYADTGIKDWSQAPRDGSRQEYGVDFNVNWKATNSLSIDVGTSYSSFWLEDHLWAKNPKLTDGSSFFPMPSQTKIYYHYRVLDSSPLDFLGYLNVNKTEPYKSVDEYIDTIMADTYSEFDDDPYVYEDGWQWDVEDAIDAGELTVTDSSNYNDPVIKKFIRDITLSEEKEIYDTEGQEPRELEKKVEWKRDHNGKLTRANNPCINGSINKIKNIMKEQGNNGQLDTQCYASVKEEYVTFDRDTAGKNSGHKWVPSVALSYSFNNNARAYARYNEAVRFPSMLEGLMSFGNQNPRAAAILKPEHSYNFELGYMYDLTGVLPSADLADIKLSFYHNTIKDFIDRDVLWEVKNFDKKTTQGIELQTRYDNGAFFGDLGVNAVLENQVCDEQTAALEESNRNSNKVYAQRDSVPRCVRDGFYDTRSLTSAVPELSTKLHLGARFLDSKLQVGSRMTYFKKVNTKDFNHYMWTVGQEKDFSSPVYGWDHTFLLDAYTRYKFSDNLFTELSGQNLTDQYYIDPASRTAIPSPGRTFKISLTSRF